MKEKKIKKKGPIRTEAVLPIVVILIVSFVFFRFFFDQSLRKTLEWTGYHIYGAEVNVSSIKTSFLDADFVVSGIQLTDKEQLTRNLVSIDKVRFHFVWDALLRAKFVVDIASVEGIQLYSPRKRAGKLLPPEPVRESSDPGIGEEVKKQSLDFAKKEFDKNILGDMAGMMAGASGKDQLEIAKQSLQAEKKIKEVQILLDEKKKFWSKKLEDISNDPEAKRLIEEIKKTKIDTKNVLTAAKDLQALDKNLKKLKEKVKAIEEAKKSLNGDINNLSSDISSVDQWIKKDIEDVKARLKVPSLDFKDLSTQLFGQMFLAKFGQYAKYIEVAKEYMPPPKSEKVAPEQIVPPKRGDGKNYRFPTKKSYPLFWLKEAKISSKENGSEYSGNLEGKLLDLTSNPKLVGKPSLILLKGEFPQLKVFGIDSKISIDNTKEDSVIEIDSKVKSFPVDRRVFSNSKDLQMGMNSAEGSTNVNGVFKNSIADFQMINQFTNIDFFLEAEKKELKSLVENVLSDLKLVDVNAKVAGKWGDLKFNINSNIGKALSDGFKRELQKKIDEVNDKIEKQVRGQIEAEKQKLTGEFAKVKTQFNDKFAKSTEGIQSAQKDANKKIEESKKSGKKQEKKLMEDLKKKFKL